MSSEIAEAVAAMILARQEERQAEYARRQKARGDMAEVVTDLREARRHGLIARHRAKLARKPRPA